MCGICGVFGISDRETVKAMLRVLAHRGPDDEHWVASREFVLGARRLSILDVQKGRQPVSDETGKVWAVQNGEIYNFPELRSRLLDRMHRLHTSCDTEILPHLYEEDGMRFVERIDGMYAVAIWDDERKVGLLARDRMGKKPLYYTLRRGGLYFASEIKALLQIPGFERRLNLEALHHFLSYKHVPHPFSIFEGIVGLPPAHLLIFRPGKEPEIRRYWDVDFTPNHLPGKGSEEELVEELHHLLRQGIRRRFMSDVPIGFFLSGGIDSSLSVALAAEMSPRPIKTFTLTYASDASTPGKEEDRYWASWVADRYGTEHYEETIESVRWPEHLRHIVRCFDEPFAGVVSTYFLSRLVGSHVKVALSGDGADELFGSYLSHRLAFPLAQYPEYQRTGDRTLLRPFENEPEFLERLYEADEAVWRSKLFVFQDEEKRELYVPEVAYQTKGWSSREHLCRSAGTRTATDSLNRILELEFRTIFPDQVLTFVDRLSMAHSLEIRTAYLDTAFVNFVTRLDGCLKIRNGETKYILKKLALKYFPPEMVYRKKEGFLMPIPQWLRRDLEPYVRETLSAERLRKHGIFRTEGVQGLLDRFYGHAQDDWQTANKILALLVFQEWYELYMT